MTKKRRAQIVELVMQKGGFTALSERTGWSREMLYAVIKWGVRRPGVDLGHKLKEELGVETTEWPKIDRKSRGVAA